MSDFDPGNGWREIDTDAQARDGDVVRFVGKGGRILRSWVREEPVPPLPTEPYTVIRVNTGEEWWRDRRGNWRDLIDGELVHAINITGFEVLAEPVTPPNKYDEQMRRETAKAVLDRMRDWFSPTPAMDVVRFDQIAQEFGVTDE